MTAPIATLPELEDAIWQELAKALADNAHGWRRPVLATIESRAGAPRADARVVVLREIDRAARRLTLYTDARSAKVGQLRAHPRGTLVFWSPPLGWQLRCPVQLSVEDTGCDVAARWSAVQSSSGARDYLSAVAPGAPLERATPPPLGAQHHFALVHGQIESIDWLEVPPRGHRRAQFNATGAHWLQP